MILKETILNMREKWEEYYSLGQLKGLQQIERESLSVFVKTCERLHIEYFVYGGTLLGAVKYKGMIRWDDDIDVAMTRKIMRDL